MTQHENPALALLDDYIDQTGIVNRSGVADAELVGADYAAQKIGTEVVDYIGKDREMRPQGGGEMYAARVAALSSASYGPGLMEKIAGHGALDARGSNVLTGRIAKNGHDTELPFVARLNGGLSWNNSQAGYVQMDALSVSVPCATGVTTLLVVSGWLEVEAANSATGIEASLVVGAGVAGVPWINNIDADTTPAWTSGYGSGRDLIPLNHERLVRPASNPQGVVNVQVSPRLRKIGGATGGYNPGTGLRAGATIRTTGDANVRSGPSLDAEVIVVARKGSPGVIRGGPTYASGHNWYYVELTGVATGYVTGSLLQVVNNDPPAAQTNRLHNGLLIVRRIPV
jgi:hypothetical protein